MRKKVLLKLFAHIYILTSKPSVLQERYGQTRQYDAYHRHQLYQNI